MGICGPDGDDFGGGDGDGLDDGPGDTPSDAPSDAPTDEPGDDEPSDEPADEPADDVDDDMGVADETGPTACSDDSDCSLSDCLPGSIDCLCDSDFGFCVSGCDSTGDCPSSFVCESDLGFCLPE